MVQYPDPLMAKLLFSIKAGLRSPVSSTWFAQHTVIGVNQSRRMQHVCTNMVRTLTLLATMAQCVSHWTNGYCKGSKRLGWPRRSKEEIRNPHQQHRQQPGTAVTDRLNSDNRMLGTKTPRYTVVYCFSDIIAKLGSICWHVVEEPPKHNYINT